MHVHVCICISMHIPYLQYACAHCCTYVHAWCIFINTVYVHMCILALMCMCIFVHVYVCICACLRGYIRNLFYNVHLCICIYIGCISMFSLCVLFSFFDAYRTHLRGVTCACTCCVHVSFAFVFAYACAWLRAYTCGCVMHVHTCTYMCVYMCVCIVYACVMCLCHQIIWCAVYVYISLLLRYI